MRSFPGMKRLPLQDRALLDLMFALEHYFPKSAWVKAKKASVRARAVNNVRRLGTGAVRPVERLDGITPQEFRRAYLPKGIPVIISNGAAGWPLTSKWSFDNFRTTYGHEMIKLVQR